MVHVGLAHSLKAEDQALLLLDSPHTSGKRKHPEGFSDPQDFIHASLCADPSSPPVAQPAQESAPSFTVASRLISSDFEERARNDALLQALRTLRQRRPSVARSNGRILPAR